MTDTSLDPVPGSGPRTPPGTGAGTAHLGDDPAAPWRRSAKPGTRGRKQGALLRLRDEIPFRTRVVLACTGIAGLVVVWLLAAAWSSGAVVVPTPLATWNAFTDYWRSGELSTDLSASAVRVAEGYTISMVVGIVLGVAIGSFRSIEAFWESPIGFLRYIPATALTPLFLLWLGIDESPKIALIIAGTVFYNILMIADVTRAVPRELITASYTLGAGRLRVLCRVILPHSWPGIIDVARINLAAAWLMLVVAELLAAQDGLGYRMIQSQRFLQYGRMFAILLIFAVIGMFSDLALRGLRTLVAPWARP
ncbi:MAG: transporter permease [Actinomycetia bacterium]|nr:transporter permease [Actinomycetes bacterium]